MPKGPQGQKRPADAIGLAVLIGKIATGEVTEESLREEPLGHPPSPERRRRGRAADD